MKTDKIKDNSPQNDCMIFLTDIHVHTYWIN